MGIWATRSPLKIHCYTCMSFETCWSRLIYTKLSSHRSFVINMYVITMAWRCISPWSFHRSLQRKQEIDIFLICQQISAFRSKNNQKKKRKTLMRENERNPWNKCFRYMIRARLWKNVILWVISRRETSPLVVIFLKKLIKLHGGLLDVNTNIYLKSNAYCPGSECCTFFHGNLSNPKSSEDTLLYFYVIWNMLK